MNRSDASKLSSSVVVLGLVKSYLGKWEADGRAVG